MTSTQELGAELSALSELDVSAVSMREVVFPDPVPVVDRAPPVSKKAPGTMSSASSASFELGGVCIFALVFFISYHHFVFQSQHPIVLDDSSEDAALQLAAANAITNSGRRVVNVSVYEESSGGSEIL